jgi:lipopolysaccharide export system ATP-binding protein
MPLLETRGLTKRYGDRRIVDDLSLKVAPGEVVALLGRSGAGKTTTFRMVAGRVESDGGEVWINGLNVSRFSPDQRRHERLGHVEEEAGMGRGRRGFFSWRNPTVEQDLLAALNELSLLPSLGRRPKHSEALAHVARVLKQFGLADTRSMRVVDLAAGQRRRLELARGLLHEPRLALLDEPFTGLDPTASAGVQAIIRRLQKDGVARLQPDTAISAFYIHFCSCVKLRTGKRKS